MDPSVLGFTILLISTVAAILAGVAVFTNIAPEPPKDDPRIGQILEKLKGLDEKFRFTQEEIQKDILLMDRKVEKQFIDTSKGILDHVDKSVEIILKAIQDVSAE